MTSDRQDLMYKKVKVNNARFLQESYVRAHNNFFHGVPFFSEMV